MNDPEIQQQTQEQQRAADLLRLAQYGGKSILDAGARYGYFSKRLAAESNLVTALDLKKPTLKNPNIECVQGNINALQFENDSFDLVLCAEVLEHIPPNELVGACRELTRVSRQFVLVGVPYRQDTRIGRTSCQACGRKNPPWGHVNEFNTQKLRGLFPSLAVVEQSFIGSSKASTNFMASMLMDFAGNPYGTYDQEETCIRCNKSVGQPLRRSLMQKVATKLSFGVRRSTEIFTRPHANWIHILFEKTDTPLNPTG